MGELDGGAGYRIEARGLRILADSPGAAGRVAITEAHKVQAAALAGSLRVTTADGTVVALVRPAMAMEFELQAETGAQVPFEMSGCLERRAGQFLLRDPLSGVVEEARGSRLESEVGNTIEVTATVIPGAKPMEGAMEVIQITRLRRVSRGCAPAAPPPGAGPAPGGASPSQRSETRHVGSQESRDSRGDRGRRRRGRSDLSDHEEECGQGDHQPLTADPRSPAAHSARCGSVCGSSGCSFRP